MNRLIRTLVLAVAFAAVFSFIVPDDALSRRKRASQLRNTVSENDVKAEIQFGREVGARVLGQYPLLENDELTRYVNLVAQGLARNSSRPEITFKVAVLKTDTINAYAAPGGFIFVTKAAIEKMENEAELAAVIAHEMGHIAGLHIVKQLDIKGDDTSAASGVTRMVGGAGDPAKAAFASMVDKAVVILFEEGYKKEDEKDADTRAAINVAISGYDPGAMVDFFRRIDESGGGNMEVLNKTHPSFEERISLIEEVMETEGLSEQEYFKGVERFNEIKKTL